MDGDPGWVAAQMYCVAWELGLSEGAEGSCKKCCRMLDVATASGTNEEKKINMLQFDLLFLFPFHVKILRIKFLLLTLQKSNTKYWEEGLLLGRIHLSFRLRLVMSGWL